MDEHAPSETRTRVADNLCSDVPVDPSTSTDRRANSIVRKTDRKQKCEGREHDVEALYDTLRSRKRDLKAAWWNLLKVVKEPVEEEVDNVKIRYNRVFLRCVECNGRHPEKDHGVLAPVRFASSHFADYNKKPSRRRATKEGVSLSKRVLGFQCSCVVHVCAQ
jgi:hypothetical protein